MSAAIPTATYRLQLTKQFGFAEAAALVPYFKEIGISHLYASPFLAARAGSSHGYDIVDHNQLSEELGGETGFEGLATALRQAGMGLILDFVPNHMGVGHFDNAWWLDVLEWGQRSPHASSFDIDWHGLPYREQTGVLLPILGRPYGNALRAGEIELKFDPETGAFAAWYFDHKLPINPQRYAEVVRIIVASANAEQTQIGRRLLEIVEPYRDRSLPSYTEAPTLKAALAAQNAADLIKRGLAAYDATTETGWPLLHRLLERQAYHLAYWRVAFSAINYRRFFDINDLAGVRVEHPSTFKGMHRLVARLIADGNLQGIRLDHVDGLRDPAQYARHLRKMIRQVGPLPRSDDFYVLIEKILGPDEGMPKFRGVHGTTGYERLNFISRLLLDGAGLTALERIWRDFTGERASFQDILVASKKRVMDTMLASEFTVLARALGRIAAGHFSSRDFTIDRLRAALEAYVIGFPVYRTYISIHQASPTDHALIEAAIARAREAWSGPDPEIFDFLRDAVSGTLGGDHGHSSPRVRNFAMKLQQFTGPVMAKSLEDTAFYRYHRLLALNEVGGAPELSNLDTEQFHREQSRLLQEQRHGLVTTATHDTKRGEDARMRILALAEIPEHWETEVTLWRHLNSRFIRTDGDKRSPSAAHEYMLYQSLVGAWPIAGPEVQFERRVRAYALKAAREGKQETSWTNPNQRYEADLDGFIAAILDPRHSAPFIESITSFARRIALLGALNSLSQIALKLTLPGVPDFFQGTEFWDLSLVDPDNRRPVDFNLRRNLPAVGPDWPQLAEKWQDGRIKFYLIRALLRLRQDHSFVFRDGDYQSLTFQGEHARHIVGFVRSHRRKKIAVLIGRHFASLTDGGRHWPSDLNVGVEGLKLSQYRDILRNKTPDEGSLLGSGLPLGVFIRD